VRNRSVMEVESDVNIGTRRSHSSTSTTRMSGQYILTSG